VLLFLWPSQRREVGTGILSFAFSHQILILLRVFAHDRPPIIQLVRMPPHLVCSETLKQYWCSIAGGVEFSVALREMRIRTRRSRTQPTSSGVRGAIGKVGETWPPT
jgi:hypothetical protein